MKRIFIIDGYLKEAPVWLKETPQKGAEIFFFGKKHIVADVIYYMGIKEVHILLNGIADFIEYPVDIDDSETLA